MMGMEARDRQRCFATTSTLERLLIVYGLLASRLADVEPLARAIPDASSEAVLPQDPAPAADGVREALARADAAPAAPPVALPSLASIVAHPKLVLEQRLWHRVHGIPVSLNLLGVPFYAIWQFWHRLLVHVHALSPVGQGLVCLVILLLFQFCFW